MGRPNAFSRCAVLAVMVAASAASSAACRSEPAHRQYELNGQVVSIASDRSEATIKHKDVPNLMTGMTMPFKVRDPKELEALKPGDLVTATLVIEDGGAYITAVKRVGEAPLEKAPEAPPASSGFELLKPGEPVPATSFVDQDGQPRTLQSFKGSTVLLTFIYTRCPMPTFCPMMDRHFVTLQDEIKADPRLDDIRLVTVSFDPVTDTPAVLKAHAKKLGADPMIWTFLTGDRDEIDKFAMRLGLSLTRNPSDPTDITHNLRTVVIDPENRLRTTYTGNTWTPAEILGDIEKDVAAS
jgi:protein SCO1/2